MSPGHSLDGKLLQIRVQSPITETSITILILQIRKLRQYFISWKSKGKVPTEIYLHKRNRKRRDYLDPLGGLNGVTTARKEAFRRGGGSLQADSSILTGQ